MSLTAAAVAVMISAVAPEAGVPTGGGPVPVSQPATTSDSAMPATDTVPPTVVPVQGVPTDVPISPPATSGTIAIPGDAPIIVPPAVAPTVPDAVGTDTGPDIVVTRRRRAPPGDPLEKINIQSFAVTQAVDAAVIEPVAKAYNKGLPKPVRQGLRNFFSNLGEPVVFIAYLLELKPGKAAETAGRFAINSTIGVAGLVDMAKRKPFNLPYRPNGFADLLGYYGIGPGPFFYLPIIGPTTLRDVIGDTVDKAFLPVVVGSPFNKPVVATPSVILDQLGERAAFDEEINSIRKEDDPYTTYRELYLRQRKAEIDALHGRVTPDVVPVYGPGMKTAGGKAKPSKEVAPQAPAAESTVPEATTPEAVAPKTSTPETAAPLIVPETVQP